MNFYIITEKQCPECHPLQLVQAFEGDKVIFESMEAAKCPCKEEVIRSLSGYYCGYRSRRDTVIFLPNDLPLALAPSQKNNISYRVVWQWGYNGNAPSRTALALLYSHTGDEALACAHYQDFEREVVACWSNYWSFTPDKIDGWLAARRG